MANGIGVIKVAGGNFSDPLTLVSDMEIIGGYLQDFSDFGANEVTTIFGTGSAPAVTINGTSNSNRTVNSIGDDTAQRPEEQHGQGLQ